MTGAFDTLIYTDCRPAQGLRGDPGLQFQAKSPGIGAREMDLVQRALLYDPPTAWINERRPVDAYPPSLAHVWDHSRQVLATAQGAYLGQEANGTREGNQITHAIVTADPDSYGFVRPAQLLNAPFWRAEPARTTECPHLEDGWQPGPAGPEAIRDFVAAQQDGRSLLVTLLSALRGLDAPRPRRVLFVAERAEEVIQWIAAATLLLPQHEALKVGFKVFTTNPSYCPQPVLAVHPDWAGSYGSAGTSSGFVVLDLVSRQYTDIPADDQVQQWVDLFLDADPYDVMDAVELASTIESAGAAPAQAAAVAVAVTFGHIARHGDLALAAGWVADGAAGLVADHGDALVATLLDQASARDLRLLDAATVAGRVPGSAVAIRFALLRTEIAAAEKGRAMQEERLPSLPDGASADANGGTWADMVISALGAAPYESVDAVLKVAWRHRISVPVGAWARRAGAFAAWWAERPDLPCNPACWPEGAGVVPLLRQQLSSQLSPSSDRRSAAAGAVRQGFWRLLLDTAVDPDQVLDAVVMAAAMTAADEATRQSLIERLMTDAASSPHSAAAVARTCQVLWAQRAPEPAEALTALMLIPEKIPAVPMLTDALHRALGAGWRAGDLTSALDAVQILRSRRLDVPEAWRDLSQEDRRLQSLCAALTESGGLHRDVLKRLRGVDGTVATARAGQLALALSRLDNPDVVSSALADLPDPVSTELLRLFARDYARQPARTVRREFRLLNAKRLPQPFRRRLEDDLRKHLARGEAQLAGSVSVLLAADGKAVRADWDAWLAGRTDPRAWVRR
jgi:hypothetical protein